MNEGAIPNSDEAWRRSWEIACVLQENQIREFAGACTLRYAWMSKANPFGFTRLYIRPSSRRLDLNRRLMRAVMKGFEAMGHQPGSPRRLMASIENKSLSAVNMWPPHHGIASSKTKSCDLIFAIDGMRTNTTGRLLGPTGNEAFRRHLERPVQAQVG